MARLFDDALSEHLTVEAAAATAAPVTMAGWFNTDDGTSSQGVIGLFNSGSGANWLALLARNSSVVAWARESATDGQAQATGSYSTNTWHHACGVFTSSTSRTAYLDGNAGSANTATHSVTGIDRTSLGRLGDSSPSSYISGQVAECAMWDVALTQAEITILAAGYSPLLVRPGSLVGYWPLVRGLNDRISANNLTATGTAVAVHPRIFYPKQQIWGFVPSPAAAATTGIMTTNRGFWGGV